MSAMLVNRCVFGNIFLSKITKAFVNLEDSKFLESPAV